MNRGVRRAGVLTQSVSFWIRLTPDERERLRIASAREKVSHGEFIARLLASYEADERRKAARSERAAAPAEVLP